MKTKISRLVGKLTIPFLIFCTLAISITAVQAAPSVSISPAASTVNKGDTFSVSINIDPDGNQVKGLELLLKFDSNSLQLGTVSIGGFLGSDPLPVINKKDNTLGTLQLAYTVNPENPAVTASGTFATLNFTVKGNAPNGTTNLNFDKAVLSDQNGLTISGVSKSAGTVTIEGTTINTAPVASDKTISTTEGTPVAVTLTATDADGDALTYTVVSSPTNGTLSGTAPALTYTPNAGFTGTDSFTYKANDSALDSNIATVMITVSQALPTLAVSILPAATAVNQSDTFSVDVFINPLGEEVKGVEVTLKFDPNSLQLDSVAIGDFLGSNPLPVLNTKDNVNGVLKLALTVEPGNPAVTASGTFATLNFIVKSDAPVGTSNLQFEKAVLSDSDGMTIPGVAKNDGTVTVGVPAPGSNLKWKYISVPYLLNNSSADYVLRGLVKGTDYTELYAWDSAGKKWVSPVTDFMPLNGYLIRMDISKSMASLEKETGPYALPSLKMNMGWNLVGTSGTSAMSAEIMLDSIVESYYSIVNWNVAIQDYDTVGVNSVHIPPGQVGTDAFMMQPGIGYWVSAKNNAELFPIDT